MISIKIKVFKGFKGSPRGPEGQIGGKQIKHYDVSQWPNPYCLC